jgi:hypothetical protein
MTVETSIDALTTQTSALLDVCTSLKNSTTLTIANAVTVSTNTALVPLITMAKNLIDTQTLLVTYMSGR